MKQAREKELKYLRELGVYEKVDERTAVAKYTVTPVHTMWVDTDKAFEERANANPFTNCCQRIQNWRTVQTCMWGLHHWKLSYPLLQVTVQSSH